MVVKIARRDSLRFGRVVPAEPLEDNARSVKTLRMESIRESTKGEIGILLITRQITSKGSDGMTC